MKFLSFPFFKSSTPLQRLVDATSYLVFYYVIISKGERSGMPGMSSIENEITSGNKIFVLYAESGEKGRRGRRREKERERSGAR